MRKWIGAVLALALAACVLAPPGALAAGEPEPTPLPTPQMTEAVLDLGADGGNDSQAAEITGTICASLISAVLPSNIAFTFDPAAEFDPTAGKNQVDTPSAAAAANRSVVPVVLEITQVRVKEDGHLGENPLDGSAQTLKLKAHVNDQWKTVGGAQELAERGVGEPGTAILALRPKGEQFASLEAFEQYALLPTGSGGPTETAPLRAATLPAESTVPLEVYGKFASDRLYGEYAFSVGVTLKVRALRSGESWDYLPGAD